MQPASDKLLFSLIQTMFQLIIGFLSSFAVVIQSNGLI